MKAPAKVAIVALGLALGAGHSRAETPAKQFLRDLGSLGNLSLGVTHVGTKELPPTERPALQITRRSDVLVHYYDPSAQVLVIYQAKSEDTIRRTEIRKNASSNYYVDGKIVDGRLTFRTSDRRDFAPEEDAASRKKEAKRKANGLLAALGLRGDIDYDMRQSEYIAEGGWHVSIELLDPMDDSVAGAAQVSFLPEE